MSEEETQDDTVDALEKFRILNVYDIVRPASGYAMARLNRLALEDPFHDINLVFNSEGGDTFESIAFVDAMNVARSQFQQRIDGITPKINGVVHGRCWSAATFILQYCDTRRATENSVLMVHGVSQGSRHAGGQELRNNLKMFDGITKAYINAYTKRSNRPESFWKKLMKDDVPNWLTAKESLDWGIIDEIIPVELPNC